MTYIVSGGALNSTESKPGGATDPGRARFSLSAPLHSLLNVCYDNSGVIRDHKSRPVTCHVPALRGHLGIARLVRPSVPWRSCLGARRLPAA